MQQAKHGGGVCEAPVTEGAGELPESAPPPQFSDASAPQLPTSAGQPASVQGLSRFASDIIIRGRRRGEARFLGRCFSELNEGRPSNGSFFQNSPGPSSTRAEETSSKEHRFVL